LSSLPKTADPYQVIYFSLFNSIQTLARCYYNGEVKQMLILVTFDF
jgi:hypothetical protein